MDLIQEINRSHGLNGDLTGRNNDPVVTSLRGKLERACERLSKDLYNSQSHFILEFVQNADDNHYKPGVDPTLHLRLSDSEVIIKCNEKGFDKDNVKAICDIGASTKARQKKVDGYIGEKGIGFKAVFAVAQRVRVASGDFTFRFDRDGPLGMINPIWDASYPSVPGWTTFRLTMTQAVARSDLKEQIKGIQSSLLLFLRKLRAIDIDVAMGQHSTISVRRIDEPNDVIRLERHENSTCVSKCRYIVSKQTVKAYAHEEKREGIEQSEIVLAFPIDGDGRPAIGKQDVHAFLPVATYGLNFVVQADFLTSSSREDIIADSQWNRVLLQGVTDTFLAAIERFRQHHILRDCWMRYIPRNARVPFSAVEDSIVKALRSRPILRDIFDRYQLPTTLITIPSHFRLPRGGDPLIGTSDLPSSQYYISSSYDTSRDQDHLSRLGVTAMSNQQFLGGLRVMDKRGGFTDRSDEWHETVCRYLNINIPRPYGRFDWDILDLCILPLADGTWGRAASASECCFPTELDLSHLVGLKFISPKVRPGTLRYAFLEALGVRPANAVVVANHILQSNKMYALSDMVRFAHFFYSHQDDRGFPSPSGLAVMDANENKTTGNELYLDATMADGGSLRSILPNARFIHAAYAPPSVYQASSWRKWLREHLGVHIRPRVIYGKLSPEFRMMTQTLSELETPRRLLGVLQEYWPFISQELSRDGLGELSATAVTCVDGVRRKLAETALHRRALRMAQIPPQSLHFIDVSNPDDPRWDFLQTLGVMVEPNAIAWLEVLKRLQATELLPAAMISAVEEAYKQLNARFNEASDEIRQTFRDHPLLLLISGDRDNMSVTWTGMSSAYWEGPSYLSDVLIKHSYPYLRDFFVDKLGLPTGAPPRAVIDRLLQITQTYVDMELQKSVHDVVERILLDVAEWCAKPPRNMQVTSELKRLQNKAIFPVLTTEGTIMLRSVDRFYVRRSSLAQLEKLEGRIPLLVTTPRLRIPDIEPLLDSEIWSTPVKYLEPPAIEIQHKPEGDLELSMALRERYTEPFRLQCIRSTICHTLGSRARQRDSKELIFAGKLSSMTIGTVGAIVETISLPAEDVSHVTQLASHLEETDEGLRILVARTTIEDADEKIIGQLSQRLGIDLCRMFMYMKSPRKDVLRILKLEGIDITSADYVEDNDSFPWDQYQEWQSTPSSAPSASIARSRASDLSRGGTRLENSFTSQLTVSERRSRSDATETQERQSLAGQVHDAMRNLEECLGSISLDTGAVYATDSLENSPLEIDLSSLVTSLSKPRSSALVTAAAGSTQTRRDTSGLSAITSTPSDWALETASADAPDGTLSGSRALNTGTTSTIASIFTSLATSVAAIDDVSDYQIVNGILGERYAYAVLSKLLGPSFGPDNWTSELRGQVPGFTYYEGNPLADFRCPDDNGVLTGRWYGEEVKKRWEPEWPTYHVEVKATSRSREEPFHMKRAQLRTALQLTAQSESLESPPKHVYILMRVSGIRSGRPTHMVFIDPHRWIYKGALVIESDIEVSVDVNALPTT